MLRPLLVRAGLAVPTLLAVSLSVFLVLRLLPADPVAMSLPPAPPQPATPGFAPISGWIVRCRLRRCLGSPQTLLAGALAVLLMALAQLAPLLAPHNPQEQDLLAVLLRPAFAGGDAAYPLGADTLGHCVLSRLLYGARIAMAVAVLLDTALGFLAGYAGGALDTLIGRLVDVWMAIPPIVFALILLVGLDAGVDRVILAIVLIDWTRFCRIVRAEAMTVARRDYITSARLHGFSHARTLAGEVLPAVLPLVVMLVSLEMGIAVAVEAILSFVGLSVPAQTPASGVKLADARTSMHQQPWGVALPVLAIFTAVLAFNLLGDGLRRALDPRTALRHASA